MHCDTPCRCSRKFVLAVVLGQICAIGNSASGVFNDLCQGLTSLYPSCSLCSSTGCFYFMGTAFRSQAIRPPCPRCRLFLLSGILDITANSLAIMSFVYTSVGAVLLILCLSTPFSMILSLIITKARFSWMQVMFSCFATGFAILFVILDTMGDESKHRVLGDLLAVASAFIYGLTSVINEFVIGSYTPVNSLPGSASAPFLSRLFCFSVSRQTTSRFWRPFGRGGIS